MRSRERLGTGVEFTVFAGKRRPDKVLKIPHYPTLSDTGTKLGQRFRERTEHDLHLLKTYIGEEYLLPTKVRSGFSGAWGIEQQVTNDSWLSSKNPATEQVLDQLNEIANRSRWMIDQTGYSLDWFGVVTQAGILELVFTAYWGLPSLAIVDSGNELQLKVVDSGLLYTGTKPSDQFRLPHEQIAWYATLIGLQIVGRKTGISFL
jgi:hypothetical protein